MITTRFGHSNPLESAISAVTTPLVSDAVLTAKLKSLEEKVAALQKANLELDQELRQDIKTEHDKRVRVETLAGALQEANEVLHKRAFAAEKERDALRICVRNVIDILRNPWNLFRASRKALRYLCVADATKAFFKI